MGPDRGMPAGCVIRQLTPADIPAYRPLRLEALRLHPEAFASDEATEAQLSTEAVGARMPAASGGLFGGFIGNDLHQHLAGMAGLIVDPRPKLRHKGVLVGMYVAAPYRRSGLNRALVQHVIDRALGAGLSTLQLSVTLGNDSARRLYMACGFRPYGVEPAAIRVDGRCYDTELMALRLSPAATRS